MWHYQIVTAVEPRPNPYESLTVAADRFVDQPLAPRLLLPWRVVALTTRARVTRTPSTRRRSDFVAVGACAGLVTLAVVVGIRADNNGSGGVHAGLPPLAAHWMPHAGVGTPLAVGIAILVVGYGPALASRLSWRTALMATYAAAIGWTFGLAMIDGWRQGIVSRLLKHTEYLRSVPRIDAAGIGASLHTFTDHILQNVPDAWPAHVAGHPPGAILVFVELQRLGMGGGAWAGVVCVVVGCLAAVAVPSTMRTLGAPASARRILPFCVLFPGAVWVGCSADGLFTGVTTTGVAVFAYGCRRTGARGVAGCAVGGLLLGVALYLSYGLMLLALVVLAVAALSGNALRAWRSLLVAGVGVIAVALAFTAAGFWWLDGYHLLVVRYYQGVAAVRPYSYWVWANLASLCLATGPAVAAGLARLRLHPAWAHMTGNVPMPSSAEDPRQAEEEDAAAPPERAVVVMLAGAAALALVLADLSGLSKAEVERIWLPFGVWLAVAVAILPLRGQRGWLAGQAGLALAVNHLLLTSW